MAPRQGASAGVLLCTVCFVLFLCIFEALAIIKYDREHVIRDLRCEDFMECSSRVRMARKEAADIRVEKPGGNTVLNGVHLNPTAETSSDSIGSADTSKQGCTSNNSAADCLPGQSPVIAKQDRRPIEPVQTQHEARDSSVFCLPEAWFQSNVPDSAFQPLRFSIHCLDRVKECTGKSREEVCVYL
ncbi:hypothetical protein WMY93_010404 [Mugilogobius chulae]|uniref:Uncharacterized protein n=1 Tax=Mugilogobius chulae TaxID=88201 RepID=A0AAW0P8H9_9GOBI